jgi:hypothetical protein
VKKTIKVRARLLMMLVLPLTPKTIKQKSIRINLRMQLEPRAKYWAAGSQLRNINDRRAADARAKYKVPNYTINQLDQAPGS